MRFESRAPEGGPFGLVEAALRGLPAAGVYAPCGEADLRPALYAPVSSFPDFAAAATLALFPDELDPRIAERLAASAFESAPSSFAYGEDILLLDLAGGPSGSSADYGAAFLAGILAAAGLRDGQPRLVLAAGIGPDGAALAEALSGAGKGGADASVAADGRRGELLVLLRPRGGTLHGIKPGRLARQGGRTLVLDVECGADELSTLLAAAAGKTIAGLPATVGCPSNPARFAARIILHAAAFFLASRGSSGDVLGALAPGDGLGLAAALWGWRLGLPESGLVFTQAEGAADSKEGRELVERFDAVNPGALHSLVRGFMPSEAQTEAAREAFAAAGGPGLDLASACSLAAAELALDSGLRGHARVVVYREALPPEDEALPRAGSVFAGSLSDPPADASIPPRLDALDAALLRLRRELDLDSRIG